MGRILSGVQPTGNLHLGNYLGAIRNWVKLQGDYECLFMLADLHAITVPQDPEKLRSNVRETAAAYIACGIDPDKSAIFHQSAVSAHAELAWILSCHTPLGWLNRMTQFKEKTGEEAESPKVKLKRIKFYETATQDEIENALKIIKKVVVAGSFVAEDAPLGLFAYPVLMAADIIVYKATHVPVGEDQKQHLELCRDIAGAFNRQYCQGYTVSKDEGGFFPLPKPVIMGEATRVMSLKDGTKKMSKSDESDLSRINLTDDADAIAKKFKRATSDSFPTIGENIENRPETSNLVNIYAALTGVTRAQVLVEFGDKNFSVFKPKLAEVAVEHLAPISSKMRELLQSPDYIDKVLARGVERAQSIAGKTMKEVKDLVGFLNV